MRLDNTIIKNISSLFSIKIAGYLVPLITLPYLVRVLEPVGYGQLGFCLAIIQYFIIFVNYGFDLSATQKVAQNFNDKYAISLIFWNVLFARLLMTVLGLVILFLLSKFNQTISEYFTILICGYLSVLGTALFPQWLFQGKERLGVISTLKIITQLIGLPLIFIFINKPGDVWLAALLSSLPSILIVFFSSYLIIKRGWISWRKPSIYNIVLELKDGWHLFLSTAAISIYTTSITVALGIIAGPVSVAIYVSANKLLQAAQGLYTPLSTAFYPRINNLMKKSADEGLAAIRYLMKMQFILTFIISVCLFIFAPYVVEFLYGDEYAKASTVLRVLSVLPVIIGLSNIFGIQTLLVHGYKKEFSKILLLSGLISIFTLLPLCYLFASVGAAFSVVITEFIVTVLMLKEVLNKKIPLFKRSL
ncbi:flippase [Shewanella profunda]|uniref:flippase n=1 Tax=Shewanella profunda TaxID=254793 RepID=UPI00200E56B0|nr:flippase [Shewanella profunda]MCL1090118.1 flippase [Shewanella profunda]